MIACRPGIAMAQRSESANEKLSFATRRRHQRGFCRCGAFDRAGRSRRTATVAALRPTSICARAIISNRPTRNSTPSYAQIAEKDQREQGSQNYRKRKNPGSPTGMRNAPSNSGNDRRQHSQHGRGAMSHGCDQAADETVAASAHLRRRRRLLRRSVARWRYSRWKCS